MDDNTRDLALTANTKIDQHMTDCTKFREALRQDLIGFREDIKKINWRVAMMLGGLIIISHGVDYFLGLLGHK